VPQLPSTNFNHANLPATSVLVPGNAPLATEPRDAISSAAELSLQRTPIASVPSPVLAPSLPANSTKQIVSDGRDALQPGQPLWEVFLQLVRQAAASESRAEAASEVVAAQEDAFAKQIQSVVAEIQDLRQQMPRGEGIGAELAQWKKDDAVAQQRLSELITTKFRELSTKLNADLEKRDREQRGALRKEWESLLKETKAIQQKLVDFSQERKSEEKRLQDLEQENAALRKEIEESRSEQRHLREELQKLERKKKPKK
jgi:chromosome segregation ATPase